jgi:hypothetical protein
MNRPLKQPDSSYQTMNHEFNLIYLMESLIFEQVHHDFVGANDE